VNAALAAVEALAGIVIAAVTGLDVVGTLVVTEGTAAAWRPARVFYHWTWQMWRALGMHLKPEQRRERWLSVYGPLSMLTLLLLWLVSLAIGWALIYMGLLGQLHGASDFLSLLYYSGSSLLTPSFGEVSGATAPAGILTLVETVMGFGTIALLISYLPVLYGAYNRREARLLTLDDPSGERITPGRVVTVHAPDADHERLYQFFAEWELWAAEILESHVSYPMLAYFRSQHPGQSWITALGVVLDAAVLTCAMVPGALQREPYFMYRRGRRAIAEINRRLHVQPAEDALLSRELLGIAYGYVAQAGLRVDSLDTAWERLQELRSTYAGGLQGLMDYLEAPAGFWGHSADLGG